ncbi:hypothetical protein ARMGADRAFT_1031916 [Armillaria gallica]|uniref:Uncharacterized protein n=1 Tax=Armillaria gallica TaxID=47427 RepID=A0A2H3D7N7_ARMGA|nr:hypothetical protein ARMGADRAFT_1031916 [Armillaria gallica]
MLFPTRTPNSQWEFGDQTTLPNTFGYETNPWHPTPPLHSLPLTSNWNLRSSPYTTPTVNLFHPTWVVPGQHQEIMPGWSYPIPTTPPEPVSEEGYMPPSLYDHYMDNSPMTLMPQISSTTDSDSSGEKSSTHSDMTTMPGPEMLETLSTPTVQTLTGPNSQSETKKSSDPSRPPPGNSGGRTSNEGWSTETGMNESQWHTSSPLNEGTPSLEGQGQWKKLSWPESLITKTEKYMALLQETGSTRQSMIALPTTKPPSVMALPPPRMLKMSLSSIWGIPSLSPIHRPKDPLFHNETRGNTSGKGQANWWPEQVTTEWMKHCWGLPVFLPQRLLVNTSMCLHRSFPK